MSGGIVQNAQDSATAGATSIAVTLGAAITAGNAVVAFVGFTGGTAATVTMGNGTDTLTLQGSIVNSSGTRMAVYAKVNCTGGGSTTFTWSNATSLTNRTLWVIECSGIDTSAAVVANANPATQVAPGTGTDAVTTGTVTNSAGLTAFHIGVGSDYEFDVNPIVKGTGATQVGSNGWTLGGANASAIIEYKAGIAASAGDALTYTGAYAGHTYKTASVMLKEAAVGGGTAGRNRMMMGLG
jgi:hypothetical protein